MEKERKRNGKRTRRTRQQILEADAAVTNVSTVTGPPAGSADGISNHQKKSLRIMFQDAKSGKLGKQRRSKIRNYVWPRTVENTKSPIADQSGKNKLFFLLSIDLFPESKVIQPSDTESEDEENYEPVTNDNDSLEEPSNSRYSSTANGVLEAEGNNVINEPRVLGDKSPSPATPKVRRGRRPAKPRRVPYGRANDQDHSWRSNYSRRSTQRRGKKQNRERIWDSDVINDIISSVIERYRGGQNILQRVITNNETDTNNNELQM